MPIDSFPLSINLIFIFLVVDIPSLEYLRSLEQSEAFNSFLNSNKHPEVVVHFSQPHIFDTSEYKRFLELTRARRHLVINETNKYSGLIDVHRRHVQFNQLDHDIFPPLKYTFLLLSKMYFLLKMYFHVFQIHSRL